MLWDCVVVVVVMESAVRQRQSTRRGKKTNIIRVRRRGTETQRGPLVGELAEEEAQLVKAVTTKHSAGPGMEADAKRASSRREVNCRAEGEAGRAGRGMLAPAEVD